MNSRFESLFRPMSFPNGIEVSGRFVMAPMVINSSNADGTVTDADIAYFKRRAKTGQLLITAACYNDIMAQWLDYQYGIFDDKHLPGMTEMAQAMKSEGAKAIMQVYHTGREASVTQRDYGVVYGPSTIKFPFLEYEVTGMSERKIQDVIGFFGDATRRAIKAGFDGLEIHGANHYLIQQFFSTTSNKRTDKWGGSLEKRSAFALAIFDEVKRVAKEESAEPFILGYRISPEEIHGSDIGYTLDDSLYLIEQLVSRGVDYIHSSLWGVDSYKNTVAMGAYENQSINQVIKSVINKRCPLIVVGGIGSAEAALDALEYGDLVAMAAAAIAEPDLAEKIRTDRVDEITLNITGRMEELKIPYGVKTVRWILESSGTLPQETLDALDTLKLPDHYVMASDQRIFN